MVKIQPKTFFVGKNIIYLTSCHSTNEIASQKIQNQEIIDGTVIITDFQTNGKGQRGNNWESEPGQNLLLSLIIDSSFLEIENSFYLSIITSNALFETFKENIGNSLKIKWPNDLYISQKKIGGVLIENTISSQKLGKSIIGIGINVFQKSFSSERATSVIIQKPEFNTDLGRILENLLLNFEKWLLKLKSGHFLECKSKYLENLFGINQIMKFKDKNGFFKGIISGIDSSGKLEICFNSEKKYYDIKEIEYVF